MILAGLVSLGVKGLNYSIEFVGGTSWTVPAPGVSVAQAQAALTPLGFGGATITQLGSGSKASLNVEAKLAKGSRWSEQRRGGQGRRRAGSPRPQTGLARSRSKTVGPTWGGNITHKAVEALIVFLIVIAAYI